MNYEMMGLLVGLILQTVIIIGVMKQSDTRLDATNQRIDATNQRIDKCIEDNKNLHKEIMELIKKL